jgi:2-hydroxycyclohexanecarboxyl-CoA dehydrogenase
VFDFNRRVVLVTGGGSGIGAATCAAVASLGATVIVGDIRPESATAVAEKITADHGVAHAATFDVADLNACTRVVNDVLADHGKVDVLITCAGWSETHPLVGENPDYWNKVIGVNYLGTINPCFAVLPAMKEAGYGRIVTFASDAARVGTWGEAVYAGAKAGVIGFTKSIAREAGRSGVVANVVSPGITDTPLMRHQDQSVIDKMVRLVTLKRVGQPSEVAAAAVFLASTEASFITGQVLSVSGGLTMVD